MNEGNYQIYQPGHIGKGDSELGNPSIFRGENAVRFQGVYKEKNKKKGGTSKNQDLPAIGPKFASLRSKQYKWKFGAVTWASQKNKKPMGSNHAGPRIQLLRWKN